LAGATIDHLASVIIFIAAMLLFISLFNQTIQTAVIYQQHRALATKCSDLLDTMLLNPGIPVDAQPTVFGLHDTNFTQYVLDPFSLMHLNSSTGTPVYYNKTGLTYSNMTVGFGNSLLMPMNDVVNYSSALKMLGINDTYGFQLTLTPIVTISINETSTSPLTLSVNVRGVSFPLANAAVSYCLIPVSLNGAYPDYLVIPNQTDTVYTGPDGIAPPVVFPIFTPNATLTYAFVAYAQVGGVAGVGFYVPPSGNQQLIPFVESLNGAVLLAHSSDVPNNATSSERLTYNAVFVKFSDEDFEMQDNSTGDVWSGAGYAPEVITVPNDQGILVVAYKNDLGSGGVAVMPWGVGSLAFPVTFGGNPAGQEWVATDMRQVLVNGVAYQAKLSLWSFKGIQVIE
jgi:hypothetical protein